MPAEHRVMSPAVASPDIEDAFALQQKIAKCWLEKNLTSTFVEK